MAQLNSEVRHVFRVRDLTGTVVTGLTGANFTPTLRRRSGNSIIASAEVVSFAEIGGGDYWVSYTPTAAATLYQVKIVAVSSGHALAPDEWQDDVAAVSTATAGPYLTTFANVKAAFNFSGDNHDAQINALLPQVTDLIQSYCDRNFFQGEVTEYPRLASRQASAFFAWKPPIVSVTSVHLSLAIPRLYDATTLLVEGTDFIVDESAQWIEFTRPRYLWGARSLLRSVKFVYVGGYSIIPGDLERAAQEIIGVKCLKAEGKLYHLLGENRADGSMQGIRFDDVTPNALSVMDNYRLWNLG